MADRLACWKCGSSLEFLSLARRDECPACAAELHVCRMCRFYDPGVSQACREPVADPVLDKERANFCGYFEPAPNAFRPADGAAARARQELEALFGKVPMGERAPGESTDTARAALDRLFGPSATKP